MNHNNNFISKIKNFFSKKVIIVILFLMILIPGAIYAVNKLTWSRNDTIKHRPLKTIELTGELSDPNNNLNKFLVPSVEIDDIMQEDEIKEMTFSHLVFLKNAMKVKPNTKLFLKATYNFVDNQGQKLTQCPLEIRVTDSENKELKQNLLLPLNGSKVRFNLNIFSNDENLTDGQTILKSTYEIVNNEGKTPGPGSKIEFKQTLVA